MTLFEYPEGATPLDPDDAAGLIPTWVATRSELNQLEQENVTDAMLWASGRSWTLRDFDQAWLRDLHLRMFRRVWTWAGTYRSRDTNLGVPWYEVPSSMENLLLDLRTQTDDLAKLPWPPDELAIRFHHRLVSVHPFSNGNGRHARLAADLVIVALGEPRFAWGAGVELAEAGPARQEYLQALRVADASGKYEALVAFARR